LPLSLQSVPESGATFCKHYNWTFSFEISELSVKTEQKERRKNIIWIQARQTNMTNAEARPISYYLAGWDSPNSYQDIIWIS
jgi:hypothetical protein